MINTHDWMTREQALAALGIKAQTLYAYVSRNRIEVRSDPSRPHHSLYLAQDVRSLAERRARSRKPAAIAAGSMSWGEPSIVTGISTVDRGRLIYRGQDAILLSDTATLESVAGLLWDIGRPVRFAVPDGVPADPFAALAACIRQGPAETTSGDVRWIDEARTAIGALAAALGVRPGDQALHAGLARCLQVNDELVDPFRRALVLIADHELNASTFATRVAASTGAALPACLMAGLCALSGPRHGQATALLARLVGDCALTGVQTTVRDWRDRYHALPGFGHPLYPTGDVRARALLAHLPVDPLMRELADAAEQATGCPPNVDFALLALARASRLPAQAPFKLFLLGRSIGWAAHAIEQRRQRTLIRPRARYQGPIPASEPKAGSADHPPCR
ncbi:MAG: citrate synthase [Burkholderiaceae bacterium]